MFHEELRAYCCRGNCAFRLSHMSLLKDLMLNEYCPELGRGMGELIRGTAMTGICSSHLPRR